MALFLNLVQFLADNIATHILWALLWDVIGTGIVCKGGSSRQNPKGKKGCA